MAEHSTGCAGADRTRTELGLLQDGLGLAFGVQIALLLGLGVEAWGLRDSGLRVIGYRGCGRMPMRKLGFMFIYGRNSKKLGNPTYPQMYLHKSLPKLDPNFWKVPRPQTLWNL